MAEGEIVQKTQAAIGRQRGRHVTRTHEQLIMLLLDCLRPLRGTE
jgi:hypothetical protein